MEVLKDRYSITELSSRLNITDHALRYYEKEFGLNIPKNERGRRYYTPELANTMFQIKQMRDDGLEIKAIKKIFESEIPPIEPPPVVNETEVMPTVSTKFMESDLSAAEINEIRQLLEAFSGNISTSVTNELSSTREHISREIQKTKLELGACVENSVRKLETKMEKHFENVDRSITNWRRKNNQSTLQKFISRFKGKSEI